MLIALGLEACADTDVSTCLSMVPGTDDTTDGSGTSGSSESESSESTTESDVGPCLGQVPTTEGTGLDTSGTDSGSTGDSGTSGTNTDDGSDSDTGPCLAPKGDALPDVDDEIASAPPTPSSWQESFARIADKLPTDVAVRLGRRGGGT